LPPFLVPCPLPQPLLQTNKAKVVANPSVVVVDDTEALITIANEVVHKVTSTVSLGVVTTNVELTKAGIFLNVYPNLLKTDLSLCVETTGFNSNWWAANIWYYRCNFTFSA